MITVIIIIMRGRGTCFIFNIATTAAAATITIIKCNINNLRHTF